MSSSDVIDWVMDFFIWKFPLILAIAMPSIDFARTGRVEAETVRLSLGLIVVEAFFYILASLHSGEGHSYVLANPDFTPLWVLCALLLYWMRCTTMISYGILEVLVGIVAISTVLKSAGKVDVTTKLIAVAGGIYIIVRGMDNIQRGLEKSRFKSARKIWDTIFPRD